jgi:hypothetical protein
MATITSATLAHRTIMRGLWSTIAFHTWRTSSYPGSPGSSSCPSSSSR